LSSSSCQAIVRPTARRDRIRQAGSVPQQGGLRARVQPYPGEGQVVVVDEQQVGLGLPGQLGDHRPLPAQRQLVPAAAGRDAVRHVVHADRQPVRSHHRESLRRGLLDRHLGVAPVRADRRDGA
jgi:hypothetical protein